MKNKIIIFISSLYIVCLNVSFAQATFHLEDDHQWIKYEIPTLTHIDYILTAGQYAWAVGNDDQQVAFFDGKIWSQATEVPGMKNPTIYPAYPLSGKSPTAWAKGWDELTGEQRFAFFDGQSWKVIDVATSGDPKLYIEMKVGDGVAWFIRNPDYGVVEVKRMSALTPNEIKSVIMPSGNILIGYKDDSIFNEDSPYLTAWFTGPSTGPYGALSRIDSDGNMLVLYKPLNNFLPRLLIHNNFYLVNNDTSDYSSDSFVSHNYGSNLRKIYLEPGPQSKFNYFSQNDYYQGWLCQTTYGFANCYDTTNVNATWKHKDLSAFDPNGNNDFQGFTAQDGQWILTHHNLRYPLDPYVIWYDYKTNKLIDTKFNLVANSFTSRHPDARIVYHKEIITCAYNKNDEAAAFYYTGKEWVATPLPGLHDCNVSFAGSLTSPVSTTPDGNVWVYSNDLRPSAI